MSVYSNPHRDVFDYAKYFIKNNPDTRHNTFDGNMKLQKLLFFANLLNIAEHATPIFDEDIRAFKHGCVVESVRQRHINDFANLMIESEQSSTDFADDELCILDAVNRHFGAISARELSKLNHAFEFWENAYAASEDMRGYRDKRKSIVPPFAMRREAMRIKDVFDAAERTKASEDSKETINGVDFYYDPLNISMTDELIDRLYLFSRVAEDNAYTVDLSDGELAIY
jgi:uncharacterized phage-associated protein